MISIIIIMIDILFYKLDHKHNCEEGNSYAHREGYNFIIG